MKGLQRHLNILEMVLKRWFLLPNSGDIERAILRKQFNWFLIMVDVGDI